MRINFKKIKKNYVVDEEFYDKLIKKTDDVYDDFMLDTIEFEEYQKKSTKLDKIWAKISHNFFADCDIMTKSAEQLFMSAYVKYCTTKGNWQITPINLSTLCHYRYTSEYEPDPLKQTKEDLYQIHGLIKKGYFDVKKEGYHYLLIATEKTINFCEKYLPDNLKSDSLTF